MSMRYRYVEKGHLSQKELESFYLICREEDDVCWALLNSDVTLSNYYRRLLTYGRVNKFKLGDLKNTSVEKYKKFKDSYNFVIAKDKKDNILGYICFEHLKLDIDDEIKDLIIIKHMYISNAASHTNLDNILFWLLENIEEKCVIYSEHLYRPCNEFNGYSMISEPFRVGASKAIKFKKELRYPMFIPVSLKNTLSELKSLFRYCNSSRI